MGLSFLKKGKNKDKIKFYIDSQHCFLIANLKPFGIYLTVKGEIPEDFRDRLSSIYYEHTYAIIYKEKDNKTKNNYKCYVGNDEKQIELIQKSKQVVIESKLKDLYYREICFETKEEALMVESLYKEKIKIFLEEKFREYLHLKNQVAKEWLK